jgi:hypothetical protein
MEPRFVVLVKQDDKMKIYGVFSTLPEASAFLASRSPDPMSAYMSGWVAWVAEVLDPESA